MEISFGLFFLFLVSLFAFLSIKLIPQQKAAIVESLGRYSRTLEAGPHFIWPFIERIAYTHSLKEVVLDIPEQICITKDNVSVAIDGVLFFRVVDPYKASYGINNFTQAVIQLAQTTLRSEIGKLDLDRSFEERERINSAVILAIEHATDPWGVKVLRYEIKSILPPREILDAMEKQMRAEREKRAKILESEGDRDSKINRAEGLKQETIKGSEADRIAQANEALGQAEAIQSVARATADGIRMIGEAISGTGGEQAVRLRMVEEYIKNFHSLSSSAKTLIIPANVHEPASIIATALAAYEGLSKTPTSTKN
ncbi:MAG: stomatin-like protein [Bdellovibrio sp.]